MLPFPRVFRKQNLPKLKTIDTWQRLTLAIIQNKFFSIEETCTTFREIVTFLAVTAIISTCLFKVYQRFLSLEPGPL
jgi:hypothetical protein